MKFELALRSNSPKIEMFQQIAKDRGVHQLQCDEVIDYNGVLSCDFPKDAPKTSEQKTIEIEHDHRYVHWDDSAENSVILYANVGTKRFKDFHEKLKDLASKGEIKYIFRPFLTKRSEFPLRLSGFGVELQIKSSEYKAQDDRKVSADDQTNEDSDIEGEDKANILNGFNFNVLDDKHPDEKEKLSEFKQFLIDENNPMAPLKVWQLQDLSLQTASRVINSPKEQQLQTLIELSQNFPSYARSLSKVSLINISHLLKYIPYNLKNKTVLYQIWNKKISVYTQGCLVFMK